MQLIDIVDAGTKYQHRWPDGSNERYDSWVEYKARSASGEHRVKVAFGIRDTYGKPRRRVLVLIDGHPHAEFLSADDFDSSGEVLSEIKVPGDVGERMCRYPDEVVPERYSGLPVCGLPTRVSGPGIHNAWAVVTNAADHHTMCVLAALRRAERNR
jgi:hypothetical protein